jgi:hypothetical protein
MDTIHAMNRNMALSFVVVLALLSACGPSEGEIQATVDAAQTAAVETVHAQYTQIAELTPSPTETLMPSETPTASATPEVSLTPTTGLAGGSSADGGCDVMTFVADVTISDGEQMAPGTVFTKTWRVKNDGSCTWSTAYNVIFGGGDQMGGPSTQSLTVSVAPGATADISVELTAPATAGTYTGTWALSNAAGEFFGSFYVEIEVTGSSSSTGALTSWFLPAKQAP